jgi:hypothetical protein
MTTAYNAKQVIVTWGPLNLTTGALAEGTFVEVAPTARRASQTALMNEDGVIVLMNNKTGTVTVTLSASADVNDRLTEALQEQLDTERPVARPLLVKDHSGRALDSCPKAVLDGWPTKSYSGDAAPTYVWVFLCPSLKMAANGSNNL